MPQLSEVSPWMKAGELQEYTEQTVDTAGEGAIPADAKRKVLNRLRRAEGQLAAVIRQVEGDADCRTTIQQLAAVSKALDHGGFLMISSALRECLTDPDGEIQPEELEKLFLSLA